MSALTPSEDVYIDAPIETDPQDLLTDCYNYLATYIPGWAPSQGNLDVWILMAVSSLAAESRDVASVVPADIFRWFGANLVNIPPIDDAQATLTSTWTMINANGYTIPAGTQVDIPVAGQSPVPFITTHDTVIPSGSTVAAGVALEAVATGAFANGIGSIGGTIELLDALTFVSTVVQENVPAGGVDAELDSDYLNRLAAELQLLAPRPILASDFAIYSRNVAGVYRAAAIDNYNAFHNLLSLNDASLETSIGNWPASSTGCTLTQDATFGVDGSHSLKVTTTASGDVQAVIGSGGQVPVIPGDTYTALATVRPVAVGPRSCSVGIWFYTAGGAFISNPFGSSVSVPAGTTQALTATVTAPATAAFARIAVQIANSAGSGEVSNWDKFSIRHGDMGTTDWVPGGTSETGQPRSVGVAATLSTGLPLDATTKTNLNAYLQAAREANFIVSVMDPVISLVDVTTSVKVDPGWDPSLVQTNVVNAIATFLNPLTWGNFGGSNPQDWSNITVLRYNALLAVIGDAAGVQYVETLTFGIHGLGSLGTADITLPGVFPLPNDNIVTVTADA